MNDSTGEEGWPWASPSCRSTCEEPSCEDLSLPLDSVFYRKSCVQKQVVKIAVLGEWRRVGG